MCIRDRCTVAHVASTCDATSARARQSRAGPDEPSSSVVGELVKLSIEFRESPSCCPRPAHHKRHKAAAVRIACDAGAAGALACERKPKAADAAGCVHTSREITHAGGQRGVCGREHARRRSERDSRLQIALEPCEREEGPRPRFAPHYAVWPLYARAGGRYVLSRLPPSASGFGFS